MTIEIPLDLPRPSQDEEMLSTAWNSAYVDSPQGATLRRTMRQMMKPRMSRTQCRLMIYHGPHLSGKTAIVREFGAKNPRSRNDDEEVVPILYLDAAPPTRQYIAKKALTKTILRAIHPFAAQGSSEVELVDRLKVYLQTLGPRLLIVDSAHFLGKSGAASLVELCTDLVETTPVRIILITSDRYSRLLLKMVSESTYLRDEPMKPFENDAIYLDFLIRATQRLPVDAAHLTEEPLRSRIFEVTGGWPGRTISAIRSGTTRAIKDGSSSLLEKHFSGDVLGYRSAAARSRERIGDRSETQVRLPGGWNCEIGDFVEACNFLMRFARLTIDGESHSGRKCTRPVTGVGWYSDRRLNALIVRRTVNLITNSLKLEELVADHRTLFNRKTGPYCPKALAHLRHARPVHKPRAETIVSIAEQLLREGKPVGPRHIARVIGSNEHAMSRRLYTYDKATKRVVEQMRRVQVDRVRTEMKRRLIRYLDGLSLATDISPGSLRTRLGINMWRFEHSPELQEVFWAFRKKVDRFYSGIRCPYQDCAKIAVRLRRGAASPRGVFELNLKCVSCKRNFTIYVHRKQDKAGTWHFEYAVRRPDQNKLDRASDERKLCDLLNEKGGAAEQRYLISQSGFSATKVWALLMDLESKGVIEKQRTGISNTVVLK